MITKELLEQSIKENEDFMEMVLKNKYLHDGEASYIDVIERVAGAAGITDRNQIMLMMNKRFIPAGSILANSGTNMSLANCYYIPIKNDSLEAILDANKEMARTMSYRGGVGTDLTVLRPSGSNVNNSAKTSSGAVSFMPLFNTTTKTVCQAGRR